MKAVLFERPHHVSVKTMELRGLKSNEVLVRVTACGVCGTDLHIVNGTSRSTPPVVLGHEYTGILEGMGKDVRGFETGDIVAVDPNIACGTCFFCRRGEVNLCGELRALGVDIDGGMAEFSIVPASQLYKIPKTMSVEQAEFIEPLSCAVHGIDRAKVQAGDTVVILGGGTVGLLLLQLARISGASRVFVVEPLKWKRDIAARMGADTVIDPGTVNVTEMIMDLTGVGADVVIECVGRPDTVAMSLELARRGGTVELFGVCPIGVKVPVEPNCVYFKELSIVGSYVNPHTFDRSVALLASNAVRIDHFIIQKFSLEGIHDALKSLETGTTIKSFIVPSL
jgi:2-desacetyl-2-hydroxyethyl bacteriochlorophyllide A dehydrogenase